MGYAFINFVDTNLITLFYKEFNGKKWRKFYTSPKICELTYAKIQGKMGLV